MKEVKEHMWFDDVEWNDYAQKLVEPEWKPDLIDSNFDPEYTSLPIEFTDFGNNNQQERRGGEFWVENIYSLPIESHFSSRTVTEQSICQSFISDVNSGINLNIPSNMNNMMLSSRDMSNCNNEDSINIEKSFGVLKVKKFSYSCEPEQEIEVKKQINQYLKLK